MQYNISVIKSDIRLCECCECLDPPLVKDEQRMNDSYISCRGSTCSSPYEDDLDVPNFDFGEQSALALGDSPYQFGIFNTNGDSSTLQQNDPNVMADPFLWFHQNEGNQFSLQFSFLNLRCGCLTNESL